MFLEQFRPVDVTFKVVRRGRWGYEKLRVSGGKWGEGSAVSAGEAGGRDGVRGVRGARWSVIGQ